MSAAELAASVHADGFVALPIAAYGPSSSDVELMRTQVFARYEEFLAEADRQQLDLTLREHSGDSRASTRARAGGSTCS